MKEQEDIKTPYVVFLAEDDADDQELIVEMMKEEGVLLEFQIANTGSKAVDLLKNTSESQLPSLILLDYNLPEMSGAEILAKMKEMNRFDDVIKVVWSTSNSPIYQKKCMELGASNYIVKPTGIAGIKAIAKELVQLFAKSA